MVAFVVWCGVFWLFQMVNRFGRSIRCGFCNWLFFSRSVLLDPPYNDSNSDVATMKCDMETA